MLSVMCFILTGTVYSCLGLMAALSISTPVGGQVNIDLVIDST